jgi:hypothetical protein
MTSNHYFACERARKIGNNQVLLQIWHECSLDAINNFYHHALYCLPTANSQCYLSFLSSESLPKGIGSEQLWG